MSLYALAESETAEPTMPMGRPRNAGEMTGSPGATTIPCGMRACALPAPLPSTSVAEPAMTASLGDRDVA